jgi:hypothetical protein
MWTFIWLNVGAIRTPMFSVWASASACGLQPSALAAMIVEKRISRETICQITDLLIYQQLAEHSEFQHRHVIGQFRVIPRLRGRTDSFISNQKA